jgi:hypothetical protein
MTPDVIYIIVFSMLDLLSPDSEEAYEYVEKVVALALVAL